MLTLQNIIYSVYFLLFLLQLSLCIAKSHLKSYPCPKNFNYLWNQGFLIIFISHRRCSAALRYNLNMFSIVSIKNCNHKSLGIYYLYFHRELSISKFYWSLTTNYKLFKNLSTHLNSFKIPLNPEQSLFKSLIRYYNPNGSAILSAALDSQPQAQDFINLLFLFLKYLISMVSV